MPFPASGCAIGTLGDIEQMTKRAWSPRKRFVSRPGLRGYLCKKQTWTMGDVAGGSCFPTRGRMSGDPGHAAAMRRSDRLPDHPAADKASLFPSFFPLFPFPTPLAYFPHNTHPSNLRALVRRGNWGLSLHFWAQAVAGRECSVSVASALPLPSLLPTLFWAFASF